MNKIFSKSNKNVWLFIKLKCIGFFYDPLGYKFLSIKSDSNINELKNVVYFIYF